MQTGQARPINHRRQEKGIHPTRCRLDLTSARQLGFPRMEPCGDGFCFTLTASPGTALPLLAQATATFLTSCPEMGDMEQMARVVLHVPGRFGENGPAGRKGCDSCKRHVSRSKLAVG
jgi:hypothetical protein